MILLRSIQLRLFGILASLSVVGNDGFHFGVFGERGDGNGNGNWGLYLELLPSATFRTRQFLPVMAHWEAHNLILHCS